MSIIYKVKEELNKLQINLSEQIKGYETQPVETSDEQITQGWLEAILYVDKYVQRLMDKQIIDLPDGWTCVECGDEYLEDTEGKLVDDYSEGTLCKKCNKQADEKESE